MHILVTGANGQLGREIQQATKGSKLTYHFATSSELNICDTDAVATYCREHCIGIIINCAAYTNVDGAEKEVNLAEEVNHNAVNGLAKIALNQDITLIHISTDYVFGGTKNRPIYEEDFTEPLGVYGATKRRGEEAILESGCRYLIFRTAWLYSSVGKNFFNTMLHLTATKKDIKVVFDQVGTPTYAADLAEFLVHIIDHNTYKENNGIYHYTNEGVCSWYDFAWAINELSGHRCEVKPCYSSEFPSVVTRPAYSVLDKTKIKNTFKITIPYWRESLVKCINKINNERV